MKKIGRYITILVFIAYVMPLLAQDEAVFDSLSIKSQFDYVIDKSNTFEQFKIVRYRHMNILKKSSLDSIKTLQANIDSNVLEINDLKNKQEELNTNLGNLQTELDAVTKSKNSMSFFGQEIPKSIYNSIMWGLVFGLAILSVILFTLFKRSHSITKETKIRLSEVEEEYENHRKTALKREQKLARELMDIKVKNK